MNLKVTAGLIILAIIAGSVAYINPFATDALEEEKSPWFYQVEMDDIMDISISHRGDSVEFFRTSQNWWSFVDPPDIPPDLHRWGGIVLLLSGPQTRRDLSSTRAKIVDPSEYGLDQPQTVVDIGLSGGRFLQFRLGEKTTDGDHYYAQVTGFDDLFLIVSSWGDVITRIAKDPPIPKWYPKRDVSELMAFNVVHENPADPETPAVLFRPPDEPDNPWTVRERDDSSDEAVAVDPDRWKNIVPLLSGPPNVSIDGPLVEGGDFDQWGIDEESAAFEFRFQGISDNGVEFMDGYLLRIGDKSADGLWYYGKPQDPVRPDENQEYRLPVLLLDAVWTEKLLDLAIDIPRVRKD
jgi:hypothetical protein